MTSPGLLAGRFAPPRLLGRGGGAQRRDVSGISQVVLGNPGRCPDGPTLTIFVTDDSGSVTGGNDPIGNRYDEAAYALEKVARRCRCGQELATIIHFDVPTSADVPATPIRGHGKSMLLAGLRTPPEAASSNLGPSLRAAYEVAAAHSQHQAALVVASDFQLFDPDIERVLAAMAAFPGKVHAVVLRAAPPAQFMQDSRITITAVDYHSPVGAVARAVFGSLTTNRRGISHARKGGDHHTGNR
jgi:hypothetical protein